MQGPEAVKMAKNEDRFDIAACLKMIQDREVACKTNVEMTTEEKLTKVTFMNYCFLA